MGSLQGAFQSGPHYNQDTIILPKDVRIREVKHCIATAYVQCV